MRQRHALGARRRAAGELEEGQVVEADLLGSQRLVRLADALDGDDLLERRASGLHGAEQALDLPGRHEDAGAALGDDVARVVEVGLQLAEGHRRVDRGRDDAGADGAEKAKDEVVVVGQDERDAIALAQAERLQRAAEPGRQALELREREVRPLGALSRRAREARYARLGDEAKPPGRLRLGGVLDGLADRTKRHVCEKLLSEARGRTTGHGPPRCHPASSGCKKRR